MIDKMTYNTKRDGSEVKRTGRLYAGIDIVDLYFLYTKIYLYPM